MKKYLFPLFGAVVALASCSEIDTTEELNQYTDCVVYSHDTAANSGVLSDFASIDVSGDMATRYYQVGLNDFQLYAGAPLQSAEVTRLVQYMKDETDDQQNLVDIYYTFFQQNENTVIEGDMAIEDFHLGWLSTVYWLTFTADGGRYKVWSLPQRVQMYGNRNTINSNYGTREEKAISPRYDMSFNVQKSTVTIKATGVKYPVDINDPSKSLEFRSLQFSNIPIQCNEKGFTLSAETVDARIDGADDEYVITNLSGTFEATFEGTHSIKFTLRSKTTGLVLGITTEFDYYIGTQHIQ